MLHSGIVAAVAFAAIRQMMAGITGLFSASRIEPLRLAFDRQASPPTRWVIAGSATDGDQGGSQAEKLLAEDT